MTKLMMNDMWNYAVQSVKKRLEESGKGSASEKAKDWERNVSFDAGKLYREALKLSKSSD